MVFLFLEYKVDVNFKVYVSWLSSYLYLVVFIGKRYWNNIYFKL